MRREARVVNSIVLLFILLAAPFAKADCTSPAAVLGAREYFTSDHTLRFCDGVSWLPFLNTASLGVCSNAGRLDWDGAIPGYKYCSNTTWRQAKLPSCTVGSGSLSYASKVTDATNLDLVLGMEVSADGTKLYALGQYTNNFRIYNISASPAAPTLLGSLSNTNLNENYMFKVRGNYAYVPSRAHDHVAVVNVSNPAAPTYVTFAESNPTNQMNNVWGIEVSGSGQHAYTTSWSSGASSNACYFHVLNLANPAAPTTMGTLNLSAAIPGAPQFCNDPVSNGDYVYVTFGDQTLAAVNVSNPAAPALASYAQNANAQGSYGLVLSADKTRAFTISDSNSRVSTWNISNPNAISYVTSLNSATNFGGGPGLTISGDILLATGTTNHYVTALNVSSGTAAIVTSVNSAANFAGPSKLRTHGQYAYVAATLGDSLSVLNMGCTPVPNYGTCSLTAAIQYLPNDRVLAYCDGSNWRPLAR